MTSPTDYSQLYTDEHAGNVRDAVTAGLLAAGPQQVTEDLFTQTVPDGARVERIDLRELEEKYSHHPRRKTGTVHVQDADSFTGYLRKHGREHTEVWADPARKTLVGVINAHAAAHDHEFDGLAGHRDHRVALELIHSDPWTAWTSRDKQWMDQATFAEHLEDNAADVIDPDAATMLEIAQHFHATTGVNFKSAQRLHSGEVSFIHEEQVGARAGQTGDIDIPTQFLLEVSPYAGMDALAQVIARFRYRIRQGQLSLSYALVRPEDHARSVFDTIVASVDADISQPIYTGRPE